MMTRTAKRANDVTTDEGQHSSRRFAHNCVAAAVIELRAIRQLSQGILAKRIGVSVSTIQRIERASTPLHIDTLSALAYGLRRNSDRAGALVSRLTPVRTSPSIASARGEGRRPDCVFTALLLPPTLSRLSQ